MTAALPFAAVAMQVAGPIIEGIGANSEARAAARIDEENGRLSVLSGEQDVEQTLRDERMISGDALAQMGGAGIAIGTGTVSDLLEESIRQRDRQIDIRRQQALAEQDNYENAAQAKRKAGRSALIGAAFGAASAALSGVSNMNNQSRLSAQTKTERSVRGAGD